MDFKDQDPQNQEAMTDEQLSTLLRKWKVDGAPAGLEARVFADPAASQGASRRPWFLIPAIACACAFVLGAGLWLTRPRLRASAPVVGSLTPRPPVAPPETFGETPVVSDVVNGPESATPARPAIAATVRPDDPAPLHYAPTHVDFFSDPFGDAGRGSTFAAKPVPEPLPQSSPQPPQDAAPLPSGVYRIGNGVAAPSVLKKREPEYSEEARIAKLSGAAILKLVVGEDGSGRDIVSTQPLGLGLDEKAIEAVKAWAFKPGVKDGAPVPVMATIQVNFHLENALLQPWQLTHAHFSTPAGAARPVLIQAPYPADAGSVANDGVRVTFDVDENGVPINFQAHSADPKLDSEAIGILSGWRFRPGTLNGKPVATPATFDFVHFTAATSGSTASIVVGGNMAAANLIDKVQPVYPREAKAAHVQGLVRLQVHIGKDGHVQSLSVVSGDPMLSPTAVDAVRQWLYRPTLMNGNPVEVDTMVDVNFTLAK
jgi:TonB family protein